MRLAMVIHLGCLAVAATVLAADGGNLPREPKAATTSRAATAQVSVVLKDVPHVTQKPDFCGEACTEMWLRKLGVQVTQDQVFNLAGVDPALGRGCYTPELVRALGALGFKVGSVWTTVANDKLAEGVSGVFGAMVEDLRRGVPSIVCMHYADKPGTTEHMRLVVGYDAGADEVIYHEPAEKAGAYKRLKRPMFMKLWPLANGRDSSVVIRMALAADRIKVPVAGAGFTDADYAQHVMELKKTLPQGFTIVIQKPFVVVGDEAPAVVRARAVSTVKWAVDKLKAEYFNKDPAQILDVWLFRDKTSYAKYTKELFNDEPTTPYGYYSETDKALIMNIATGGGTLVHEIVHPFMHTNFRECPPWFNEGMGSLYEQSAERDGRIVGLTNWRLAGLQKAIKDGDVPSFEALCGMDANKFYNLDRGTNYGQARYLCYYLQEKGLLTKYYKEFVANKKEDPTGYKTLQRVLGEDDMGAFKKRWEKWVMGLRFE